MYNIDFDLLAEQLLPPILRKPRVLAWVKLLLFPLRYLNDAFIAYRVAKLLEISYNGQTMILERALNNNYPGANGGIYIDNNGTTLPRQFAFFQSENQGELGFAYFESEGEGDFGFAYFHSEYAGEIDFKVMVPVALVYDENEMRAYINKYRIAGKRYIIQTY